LSPLHKARPKYLLPDIPEVGKTYSAFQRGTLLTGFSFQVMVKQFFRKGPELGMVLDNLKAGGNFKLVRTGMKRRGVSCSEGVVLRELFIS
jgi:hypothetical protein